MGWRNTIMSRVSIYLCCYVQIYGCWNSDTKSMQEIASEPINSNEWMIKKGLKSSGPHLFWEKWEREKDYNKKSFTLSVLLWPSFMDAEFQIQKVCRKLSTKSINSNEWVINKKFYPSLLRKLRKGERLQRVEFQSTCAVMTKFYGCWNSDTKICRKFQPNQ